MKDSEIKYDYEIINGKPHFGVWFGYYMPLPKEVWEGVVEQNPIYLEYKDNLKNYLEHFPCDDELEKRHIHYVIHASNVYENYPICIFGVVCVKFLLWGRAYKIMRIRNYEPRVIALSPNIIE